MVASPLIFNIGERRCKMVSFYKYLDIDDCFIYFWVNEKKIFPKPLLFANTVAMSLIFLLATGGVGWFYCRRKRGGRLDYCWCKISGVELIYFDFYCWIQRWCHVLGLWVKAFGSCKYYKSLIHLVYDLICTAGWVVYGVPQKSLQICSLIAITAL